MCYYFNEKFDDSTIIILKSFHFDFLQPDVFTIISTGRAVFMISCIFKVTLCTPVMNRLKKIF